MLDRATDAGAVVPGLWRIEVAERCRLPLATLDRDLHEAALALSVGLLGAA